MDATHGAGGAQALSDLRQFYEIFRSYLDSALEVAESVDSDATDNTHDDISQNDKKDT